MLFNSIEFLVFLPIVFLLYWLVFNRNIKLQNLFIVIVSYIFYGWWNWRFLFLIAFTSLCSWGSGLLIEKYREQGQKAKLVNIINIVINIGILGVFKYYDFFAQSFANAFLHGHSDGLLLHIILPVGISFYTFQALSYSIDVYKGKLPATKDIIQFFAFVSFFPQLVAGPIERATNLLPQFNSARQFDYAMAVDGCRQMLWGFFKKIVIADTCAEVVNQVFADYAHMSSLSLLLGCILFTFQIYGDFSGYSDIAIGTAKLFGIKLVRNFNNPYFSRDIAEFWRRWHISLTTWFRDYVYIPLGGSRVEKAKIVRNTFVIFLLSGLWHGANWTFIAWGAYHACLFLPLILLGKNRKYINNIASGSMFPSMKECVQVLCTFVLVAIGWVIFRADTIYDAWQYIMHMLAWHNSGIQVMNSKCVIAILIILASMVIEWLQREKNHTLAIEFIHKKWMRYAIYYILFIMIILLAGSEQPFIYFQF